MQGQKKNYNPTFDGFFGLMEKKFPKMLNSKSAKGCLWVHGIGIGGPNLKSPVWVLNSLAENWCFYLNSLQDLNFGMIR